MKQIGSDGAGRIGWIGVRRSSSVVGHMNGNSNVADPIMNFVFAV